MPRADLCGGAAPARVARSVARPPFVGGPAVAAALVAAPPAAVVALAIPGVMAWRDTDARVS